MINFKLSRDLSKDLAMHLRPAREGARPAMQWFGHRFVLEEQKCVVMMESQSRYAMLFFDVGPREFQDFPTLFQERLWLEVSLLMQSDKPLPDADLALLHERVLDICSEETFESGSNRSVTSHMNQVRQHLEIFLYVEDLPLPSSMEEALQFGTVVNETTRKQQGSSNYFYPIREFYRIWVTELEHARARAGRGRKSNVIWGRFGRR